MAEHSDHDNIVTLVNEVKQLRNEISEIKTDIKDVKDNVASRVRDLELEKLDKSDAEKAFDLINRTLETQEIQIAKLQAFKDNFLGRYSVIAAMAIIILPIILTLIVNKLSK